MKINKVKIISYTVLTIGIFSILLSLFSINLKHFPALEKKYSYFKYLYLAKKFPPDSEKSLRLKAMAEAAKNGEKTYTFETANTPGALMDKADNSETNKMP